MKIPSFPAMLLLVGCVAASPLSHSRTLILKPSISSGIYSDQSVIAPYDKNSIHHLRLQLFSVDASENDLGVQKSLLNSELNNTIVFSNLKANTTYRIKAYAYADQGETLTISQPATMDIALTNDEQPTVAGLTIKLIDKAFNGQGTGSLSVTPGGYALATESMAFSIIGKTKCLAGGQYTGSAVDGVGTQACFDMEPGIVVGPQDALFIADGWNGLLRTVTSAGVVQTMACTDSLGSATSFSILGGMVKDSGGNLFVADCSRDVIYKITPGHVVTKFAGSSYGFADGTGTAAKFKLTDDPPAMLAIDSSDNLYVADSCNCRIRKVTPSGVVTTIVGNDTDAVTDGIGTAASADTPYGLALDSQGNLYFSECYYAVIRKMSPNGTVSTVAGLSNSPGGSDGVGSTARFMYPGALAADNVGNLYIVDNSSAKHCVRMMTPEGVVTTISAKDSLGTAVTFPYIDGIAISPTSGMLYIGASQKVWSMY